MKSARKHASSNSGVSSSSSLAANMNVSVVVLGGKSGQLLELLVPLLSGEFIKRSWQVFIITVIARFFFIKLSCMSQVGNKQQQQQSRRNWAPLRS